MDYQIVPYEHNSDVETYMIDDEIYMPVKNMAKLFGTTQRNIQLHIKNVLDESDEDLAKDSFVKYLPSPKGRPAPLYPLEIITAVGYRVQSPQARKFQKWATDIIRKFLLEGVAVNPQADIDDVASRVRAIRTSEQTFAKKMNAIFAMASDYDPRSEEAKLFFATVTNKLHYAIHGHTAAELIVERSWLRLMGGCIRCGSGLRS